jgi:hypothetical protein
MHFYDHVLAFLVAAVAAIVGTLAYERWRGRARGSFVRLLGLDPKRKALVVHGEYETMNPHRQVHAVPESVPAAHNVGRMLDAMRWPETMTEICSEIDLRRDPAQRENNLFVMCTSKANALAREALDLLGALGCQLRKCEDNSAEQEIVFRGVAYHSRPRVDGSVDDYGLVTRTRNPWNPEATLVLLGGLAPVGMLGASSYLYQRAEDIHEAVRGREFIGVVQVVSRHGRIERVEPVSFVVLPDHDRAVIVPPGAQRDPSSTRRGRIWRAFVGALRYGVRLR